MAAIVAVCPARPAYAQVIYQSLEDTYTQSFDTLPSTGATFTWGDNSTLLGWYASNTGTTIFNPAGVSTGSTTNGNLYSFGSTGSSDRALGSIGSGSSNAGGFYYGVQLRNNTGVTISSVTISYTGEQWRNSAAAAQTVSFQYSLSATNVKTGSYTSVPTLDFTSPVTGGTSGAINGNSTSSRTVIGPVTINNIIWPPNTTLWIRWSDPDHTGFDHGLAIDDFAFKASDSVGQYDPPNGYYASVQGLTGTQLQTALHNLISPHTVIPYASTTTTDTLVALKALEEDPADATKIKLFYSTASALKQDAGTAWTREYLWPKSRGIDDTGADSTDLFNMRVADSSVNLSRGNKYFDISDVSDPNYRTPAHINAASDTSTDSDSWQPPADQRGDVARALFYMDVRYDGNLAVDPNTTDLKLENGIFGSSDMAVLQTLLQWHRDDPVSDEERRRNQLIYSLYQHNRNPFVDKPEYVEMLYDDLIRTLDDQDLDGMSLAWEQANQFNPSDPSDAAQDSDGDGFTNLEEYWMGSDPHNAASPQVIYVDGSYTGNIENGSTANPFKRIQAAIDAVPTTELRAIVVKPGTYTERPYSNGKSRIHLFGASGATQTIIDGQQVNSSVVRIYGFDRATFSGFTVKNAQTDWVGAGVRIESTVGTILVNRNIITNNTSTATAATGGGGGLYLKTARGSRVTNNYISSNHAKRGGGVLFAAGNADFWHNTIVSNEATGGLGGGLSALSGVFPDVRNNIVWANAGTNDTAQVHQITASSCVIQDAAAGSGNIGSDPKLLAPVNGIYRIVPDSPARNNGVRLAVTVDFDLQPRPEISVARPDIGADEVADIDADGDGVPDYWELDHYGSLGHGLEDPDGDGLSNAAEFQFGTDPFNPDSDGDTLTDGQEVQLGTNPLKRDTDDDGMPDGWEVQYGTNALVPDAALDYDGDGLTNLQEYQLGTDPRNSDTDFDGMPDGWEVAHGLNPLVNDAWDDPDFDGFSNLVEYQLGTNPQQADIDSDGDGLPNTVDIYPLDFYNNSLPTISVVTGASQVGIVGTCLGNPIVVRVTDSSGHTLANAPIDVSAPGATFSALATGPYSTQPIFRTGSDGSVSIFVQLPTNASNISALIRATGELGSEVSVSIKAVNAPAAAAGEYHTVVLGSSGMVWSWGLNSSGQVGDGTNIQRDRPTPVVGLRDVSAVAAGLYHSLALKRDGTVWAWGQNSGGQLGNGSYADSKVPVQAIFPAKPDNSPVIIIAMASGAYHNLALGSDGTVYSWGLNADGELGDGSTATHNQPVIVSGLNAGTGVTAVAAGAYHSVAVTSTGALKGWGANFYGALGDNSTSSTLRFFLPINIAIQSSAAQVSAGAYHTMVIGTNGAVQGLGWNACGQLGDGTTATRSNLAAIQGLTIPKFLVASKATYGHCLALSAQGVVESWGSSVFGELGYLPKIDHYLPTSVALLPAIMRIATGSNHSLAVSLDGSVYVWGDNTFGQLGKGDEFEADTPVRLSDFSLLPTLDDTDQDNLPDWWERQYFVNLSKSGDIDSDGDGLVDLLEFQRGKNPNHSDNPHIEPETSSSQFVNISTRANVQVGDNVMIAGFIITGSTPKRVVIRAIGPSLASSNVSGAISDPRLDLHGSDGGLLESNDDWQTSTHRQEIIDLHLAPPDSRESVIVRTLNPGLYTAIISGKNNATGVALIETYDADPGSSILANISTRALVGTGDNVMIAGFIISGSAQLNVVVRVIGPTLTRSGVTGALQDPRVRLVDSSGQDIAQNDDWKISLKADGTLDTASPSQERLVRSTKIPPEDDRESAIVRGLNPGLYTAVVSGKNNTTGVALVEAYSYNQPLAVPGTVSLSYDNLGRLQTIGPVSYQYDAEGNIEHVNNN